MFTPRAFATRPRPGIKASTGFLALRKERIQWVAGGRPSEPRASPGLLERRRLAFLFGDYLLAGELQVPKGARLSDFLSQAKPFQTLLEANLYVLTPEKPIVDLEWSPWSVSPSSP